MECDAGAVLLKLNRLIYPEKYKPVSPEISGRLAEELDRSITVQARPSNVGSRETGLNGTDESSCASPGRRIAAQSQNVKQEPMSDEEEDCHADKEKEIEARKSARRDTVSSSTRMSNHKDNHQSIAQSQLIAPVNRQQLITAEQEQAERTETEQDQPEQEQIIQEQIEEPKAEQGQSAQVPAVQLAHELHPNTSRATTRQAHPGQAHPRAQVKSTVPNTQTQLTVAPPSGPRISRAPTSSIPTQPKFNRSVETHIPAVQSVHHPLDAARVTTTIPLDVQAQPVVQATTTAPRTRRQHIIPTVSARRARHAPASSNSKKPQWTNAYDPPSVLK